MQNRIISTPSIEFNWIFDIHKTHTKKTQNYNDTLCSSSERQNGKKIIIIIEKCTIRMKRTKHRYTAHTTQYIVFQLKQTGGLFMEFFEILHNFQFINTSITLRSMFVWSKSMFIKLYTKCTQFIHQYQTQNQKFLFILQAIDIVRVYLDVHFEFFLFCFSSFLSGLSNCCNALHHIHAHTNAQHIKCHSTQYVNQIKTTTAANQTNQLKKNSIEPTFCWYSIDSLN